jgi:hypothetical protein
MFTNRQFVIARASCLCLLAGICANAASSKAPGTGKSNSVPTFTPVEIPLSVFVAPATPKEGRNPFFPQSIATQPVVKASPGAQIDMSGFVLNGITSPPRRTAMINGRTFEPGEEGDVKLPNGAKVLIKCEEIGADSTVIVVNGVKRELRLRFGL